MADTELESIIARLKANTADMRRGFTEMVDKAQQSADKMAQSFEKMGERVGRVGDWMTTRVTAPFLAMTGFSVKAASDVEELMSLIGVTFGDATDEVIEWADQTSTAVNRSRFALLKTAGDFAAFLKPLGVAPEQAFAMSKAMAQLTTDIASFRNMTEEETAVRLFSGIAGETEAVRRLGVDIGVAATEAELLRLGFKGNAAEADQALKTVARFNLIMRQTKDAQGDAIRTSESFENRTKELGSVFRDVRVEIGQIFIPTATRLTEVAINASRAFLDLSTETKKTAMIIASVAAAAGPAMIALSLLVKTIGFAISGFVTLGRVSVAALGMMGRAAIAAISPLLTIPGAIIGSLTAVYLFRDTVQAAFQSIVEFSQQIGLPIVGPIRAAFQFIKDTGANVMKFFDRMVNAIIEKYNSIVRKLSSVTGGFVDRFIVAPFNSIVKVISDRMGDMPTFNFQRVKTAFNQDLNDISTKFREVMDRIRSAMPDMSVDFSSILDVEGTEQDLDAILEQFRALFQTIDSVGGVAGDAIDEARFSAKQLGEDLRQAFIGRLQDVNSLGDAMTAVFDRVKAMMLEIAFFGTSGTGGLFGPIFGRIAEGMSGIFGTRQTGGPVSRGRPVLVGERGPELFMPEGNGRIADTAETRRGGSGGVTIYQTLNFPPDNAEITERMVTISAAMRDQAISAMRQASNQGF